ncbi:hypothetical protein BECAL_00618 [Bellilinea caldifistulae]|uniref:DUF4760 domain-containing protein n=1 Tax=Bellilinea caldifistulae TaxID=360411 RepID=A0A0P6XU26_9CHLR|nr:hypothetical protein [Bellilinea caldifistulae]KPL78629.1 hypothetical protein AC812_00785 [Bellilinea caldifistulae]GAP09474.1 hypothetical protein BECAL_00618 [Bellilinea caldifistulae]
MRISISDFTSLFSILAVLVSIIALVVEIRRDRLALQVDLLLRLDDKLHSPEFKALRQVAAQKLLSNERPNYELEDLLELFSTIAFLYERKAIDADLAFVHFSYWLDRYWLCARNYVEEESRKYDPLSYKTLERVAQLFVEKELKSGYPPFSEEVLQNFLKEETHATVRGGIIRA